MRSTCSNRAHLPAGLSRSQVRQPLACRLHVWCGREDSNFHGLSATATSTLRVYQFRHDRTYMGYWAASRATPGGAPLAKRSGARNAASPVPHRDKVLTHCLPLHGRGVTSGPCCSWPPLQSPLPSRVAIRPLCAQAALRLLRQRRCGSSPGCESLQQASPQARSSRPCKCPGLMAKEVRPPS